MHAERGELIGAIAAAILDHLQTHPLAADTADGVARWWLGTVPSNATAEQVECALDLLVSRRALRRLKLLDGSTLYSQPPPTWQ